MMHALAGSTLPLITPILLQILPKSQLPVLMSTVMVVQAFLAAPSGLQAKRSLGARNQVLLLGYAAMIAADLCFALWPTASGIALPCFSHSSLMRLQVCTRARMAEL